MDIFGKTKLEEVRDVFLAATQGLTDEEIEWALNGAFSNVIGSIVADRVDEALSKQREKSVDDFEDNDSNATVDNSKAKYNIKYDDNIVEIVTEHSIDMDIESSVESGYVGAGGMHFTYDNPEETTIRLMF